MFCKPGRFFPNPFIRWICVRPPSLGGDIYGSTTLPRKLGTVSYAAYAGRRPQDPHGGYDLGLASVGLTLNSYGGWMQGEDLRWNTPLNGLLVGASL
jgi:hypothetical protein